ncbi:MAG: SsrA-binding protein SmpB [Deltaproteobacteria bacterium]|nr:SsrA-binding protein SmpB [Deltaproteobacteria bacterium]
MAKRSGSKGRGALAENRRVRYQYMVEDTMEAGIVLVGSEVKAIREGRANLADSYVRLRRGEAYLQGCHVGACSSQGEQAHESVHDRKLLLHRREIDKLEGKVRQSGYTLVVTRLYDSGGRIKAEVVLAKGKKKHDKRSSLKDRERQREAARATKLRF